jgi:hypothetical protein
MINKILFPLITIVLLSSCSNTFNLQKRKYTKGFYFATSKNNNVKKHDLATDNAKFKKLTPKTYTQLEENNTLIQPELKPLPMVETKSISHTSSTKKPETKKNVTASNSKNIMAVTKVFKELKLNTLNNPATNNNKEDSDIDLLILVILCLFPFINLIPVYLKDSKNITIHFWITLILDLLFFVPGIIFALLVVLDIVNLR